MEVVRAKHSGFCYGVRRAVECALKESERTGETIYTMGPLLHNPQVVKMLEEKGIRPIRDVHELTRGTVAFRSHGVKKEEEEYVRSHGLRAIDATCPFVKKVRRYARSLEKAGYTVVIVGDEEHPEVKSVLSYLNNDAIVLRNPLSIKARKIGVVSQTTQDPDTLSEVVRVLVEGADEVRVYNTICESTRRRKEEALELANRVDAMLIVGGKNSANTCRLYQMVRGVQPNTHHIETEEELDARWFAGLSKVGIAGGASTPDFIIDAVETALNNL
jgi:4-hydroxy-3-methylbut-2-enyl diphosphate reductase